MKFRNTKLFSTISALLEFVAFIGVKPASMTYMYQPKAPKHLTKM